MHVPDLGQRLVGIDVPRATGYVGNNDDSGYDGNNGSRAIKRHVPQKYMMRFEVVKDIVKRYIGRATG